MDKFRREIMWAALALIVTLTILSVYGAFIGAARAQAYFNSVPLAVYWGMFALALVVGLVAFRRLIRVPGLLLMHAGCILILGGGALGSKIVHELSGSDKIREGQMVIYEGQTSNQVRTEMKRLLFSLGGEFEHSLHSRTVPQELRQKFEKEQSPLSESAAIRVEHAGSIWSITDDLKEYSVRKEQGKLKAYLTGEMRDLPFSIKLRDFRIEYYEPAYLQVETGEGQSKTVAAEVGNEIDLGEEPGTARIVRMFENFKMSIEGGKRVAYEDPNPGSNPALEVLITRPDGQVSTQYVFALMPGFSHSEGGVKLTYSRPVNRAISDYISELEVTDKQGKVVAAKDIEVNHPLRYGGHHFYQSSYDPKAGRYTVLSVHSDAGLVIVYAGYWMLCLGVIWHLWLRHIVKKIGGKKQINGN
jgi:hypothetical protein